MMTSLKGPGLSYIYNICTYVLEPVVLHAALLPTLATLYLTTVAERHPGHPFVRQ